MSLIYSFIIFLIFIFWGLHVHVLMCGGQGMICTRQFSFHHVGPEDRTQAWLQLPLFTSHLSITSCHTFIIIIIFTFMYMQACLHIMYVSDVHGGQKISQWS